MSRSRQLQQSQEMQQRILATAREIVQTEGAEALSIRHITQRMDYSAGIVYHYFENKDEILRHLLLEAYQRILDSIPLPEVGLSPAEALRATLTNYVNGVLQWPEEYRAVMFSSKPEILAETAVLAADVAAKRDMFGWLTAVIEAGIAEGQFAACEPTLTAQALWCAIFGLVSRLMIEHIEDWDYAQQLIDTQVGLLMKGLSL